MHFAVDVVGGKILGRPTKVVSADHRNKAEVTDSVARKWYDDGVKMISGVDS